MTLGPGALTQSGPGQGLHAQGSLSDAIGSGLPPTSLLQGQIGNGEHAGQGPSGDPLLPTPTGLGVDTNTHVQPWE